MPVKLSDGLEVSDGVVRKDGRLAVPEDVPIRKSGPFEGQRALRVVPAGMTDSTVDADGKLSEIKPDKIVEPVEVEIARVSRG